jgi:16S rRNA processing protein RimM
VNALDVTVAAIGKAHGLRGEVSLLLRTDQPEERLLTGTAFDARTPQGDRVLTIASTRIQQGRWYARFEEVTDRTDAESLRGTELSLAVDPETEAEEDPDAWYPSELKGLAVRHVDGRELGTVIDLEHYPAQDLLIVRAADGRRVMLPFVEELVPEVDVEAGTVLADPPGGLFEDLEEESENADGAPDPSGADGRA